MKIISPNIFLYCLHGKTFSALFYIILGSASGCNLALIILLLVSLCLINFCPNAKIKSKVPSGSN